MSKAIKLALISLIVHCLNYHNSIAQVRLPQLIRDSMILQRDARIKLWGWAKPGEKIKISFLHKVYRTIGRSDSTWSQIINPTKAGGPYTLIIDATNHIVINNVLFGDVWLCSGQS